MRIRAITSAKCDYSNARVGRVARYKWAQCPDSPDLRPRRLLVDGPREAVDQLIRLSGWRSREEPVPRAFLGCYSHSLRFESGEYGPATELIELLRSVLVLKCPSPQMIDHAMAVDWTKVPDDKLDPRSWPNTAVGDLVHFGKYRHDSRALRDLAEALGSIVVQHPLLRTADAIVTAPCSRADGDGFGERLARLVAQKIGVRLCLTNSVVGPRPPMKAGGRAVAPGDFSMPFKLHGTVIVVDDVYRSGQTMSEAARAARRAGARTVFGLAAVRTLRN